MPYPDSYEILTPLTYNDCVLYGSKLTDGFLETDYEYTIGSTHKIYAKHLSTSPELTIHNLDGSLLYGPMPSTYISSVGLHGFDIDLTSATVGKYILKLTATDFPVEFTKVVKFTTGGSTDVMTKLDNIENLIASTNADEISVITTTGRRIKVVL